MDFNFFLQTTGLFQPFSGLFQRTLHAFFESLAMLLVILAAAIPWIGLLLLMSWLSLKFLRWWVRKKREAKAKKLPPNNVPL
ncbi:MAG: hypothetical protein V2A66_04125 [Pseudomonadota bacterium]